MTISKKQEQSSVRIPAEVLESMAQLGYTEFEIIENYAVFTTPENQTEQGIMKAITFCAKNGGGGCLRLDEDCFHIGVNAPLKYYDFAEMYFGDTYDYYCDWFDRKDKLFVTYGNLDQLNKMFCAKFGEEIAEGFAITEDFLSMIDKLHSIISLRFEYNIFAIIDTDLNVVAKGNIQQRYTSTYSGKTLQPYLSI